VHFAKLIATLGTTSDLIVLPEVFTTGFGLNSRDHAETMSGETCQWLAAMAASADAVVMGSLIVKENEKYYNRLLWMTPEGVLSAYDKRHLFRMADEHLRYQEGQHRLVVEVNGWRCCPMICYDLRFPVWCRNQQDYDVALFVANWPSARSDHWRSLLKARAIENLAYCVGVNRVGVDPNGNDYSGDSMIWSADGNCVLDMQAQDGCMTVRLSKSALDKYRSDFPAQLDADKFALEIDGEQ